MPCAATLPISSSPIACSHRITPRRCCTARSVAYRAVRDTVIHSAARADAEPRAVLSQGAAFHLLDVSGGWAWGRGDMEASVGYVPYEKLERE